MIVVWKLVIYPLRLPWSFKATYSGFTAQASWSAWNRQNLN